MSKRMTLIALSFTAVTFGGAASLLASEGGGQSTQCGTINDANGCPSPTFSCDQVCGPSWVIDSLTCSGNNTLCYGHSGS